MTDYEYDYYCYHELGTGEKAMTGFKADTLKEAFNKCLKGFGNCFGAIHASKLMLVTMKHLEQG